MYHSRRHLALFLIKFMNSLNIMKAQLFMDLQTSHATFIKKNDHNNKSNQINDVQFIE